MLTKIKKAMNKLVDEIGFVGSFASICLGDIPENQKKEMENIFCFHGDEMIDSFNLWMKRTIETLKDGKISIEGLCFQHEECLSVLLDSSKLDKNLQENLKKLLRKKCDEVDNLRKRQFQNFMNETKVKEILSKS